MRMRAPVVQEDEETRRRRERAEAVASRDEGEALQREATEETRELLRRFGARAQLAGVPGMASFMAGMPSAIGVSAGSSGSQGVPGLPGSFGGSSFLSNGTGFAPGVVPQ